MILILPAFNVLSDLESIVYVHPKLLLNYNHLNFSN